MRIKSSFFAFFVISVLLFSTCDLLNNDDNNDNNNGNDIPSGGVAPLLQTQWGMGDPFRELLPEQSRLGCVGTAVAQIMMFHRHPVQGRGQSEPYTTSHGVNVASINFENVYFDWDSVLNSYTNANPGTQEQRNAVARLFYYITIGIGMDFGFNRVGGGVNSGPLNRGLTTFFGYDKNMQSHSRDHFNDTAWETMIRGQLDAGLPVYYRGNNQPNTSDHAFVIDGYDNEGRFHINWGWGGTHDGWYPLNALNPGNYDFNYGNAIRINIKPDEGNIGSNEMALLNFSTDKTSVFQNELFIVNARIRSAGFFPGGQAGVALVDNDGNIASIVGIVNNFAATDPTIARTATINCFVPETLNPGQYSLRIVTRLEGGDWKPVMVSAFSDNVPFAIDFTVNIYTSVTPTGGHGLALDDFSTEKTSVFHDESFTVTVRMRNRGAERFPGGQINAVLVDNNNMIVEHIGTRNVGGVNPGSWYTNPITLNCTVPSNIAPGQYRLRIVVRPTDGEWRIATLSLPDIPTSFDFSVK
jgi:hypothetical protein